jgi:hypothetical protein
MVSIISNGLRPEATMAALANSTCYLTINDLSALSGVSIATLRRWVRKGTLQAFQPGGPGTRLLFRPDALEQRPLGLLAASSPVTTSPKATADRLPGRRPAWLSPAPQTPACGT